MSETPKIDWLVLFPGDLQIGNLHSDVPGFQKCVKKAILEYNPRELWIIFVGDLIENSSKYRTQIYKIFNVEPLYVQLEYLREILNEIVAFAKHHVEEIKIRAVLGNHDLTFHTGNIIRERDFDFDFKIYWDYLILKIGEKRYLVIHAVDGKSSGSYLTGWSGYLLEQAKKLLDEYQCDVIITAHTHRPLIADISKDGRRYIMVPSFLSGNREGFLNQLFVVTPFGTNIIEEKKNDPRYLESYNINEMNKILEKRKIEGYEEVSK